MLVILDLGLVQFGGWLKRGGRVVSARCEIKPRVALLFNLLPSWKQIFCSLEKTIDKKILILYIIVNKIVLVEYRDELLSTMPTPLDRAMQSRVRPGIVESDGNMLTCLALQNAFLGQTVKFGT